MKKRLWIYGGVIVLTCLWCMKPSFSETGKTPSSEDLVLREALNVKRNIVAVDVNYIGEDLLETKVIGFMIRTRPKLKSILVVGPGAGRLSPTARETVLAGTEEDPPFPTRRHGLIVMNQGSEDVADGTLHRERIQHVLPIEEMREKIKKARERGKDVHYEYWVYMESSNRGGEVLKFKFDLDELPDMIMARAD